MPPQRIIKKQTNDRRKSKKPLLEAIQNGEQQIKITDPKFLMACLIAEKCENDKENVKKFLPMILSAKSGNYNPNFHLLMVAILNEKGKARKFSINLSVCATAFGIIDILNDTYAKIKVGKDENGNLTGIVEIV